MCNLDVGCFFIVCPSFFGLLSGFYRIQTEVGFGGREALIWVTGPSGDAS